MDWFGGWSWGSIPMRANTGARREILWIARIIEEPTEDGARLRIKVTYCVIVARRIASIWLLKCGWKCGSIQNEKGLPQNDYRIYVLVCQVREGDQQGRPYWWLLAWTNPESFYLITQLIGRVGKRWNGDTPSSRVRNKWWSKKIISQFPTGRRNESMNVQFLTKED